MKTVLKLNGVSYSRAGNLVLDNIDLELQAHETLAVLGPSGGGKTTLLRLIAGLEAPTGGSVDVNGERASIAARVLISPEDRQVSFVFQDLALWSHMSVEAHLEFALIPQGLAKTERRARIETMLHTVNLDAHARRLPGELSGGERQRVAIARALVTEPRLVLFDEPLANLDIVLKHQLLDLFSDLLIRYRSAALYVTHDPHEAFALSHRIAILEATRLSHFIGDENESNSSTPFRVELRQSFRCFNMK
jgi:iron(III) transport system ATP-binding protein